jgi:hypothetical protein
MRGGGGVDPVGSGSMTVVPVISVPSRFWSRILVYSTDGSFFMPTFSVPRFKLNHNSTRLAPGEVDTSIWVGDLTPEVSWVSVPVEPVQVPVLGQLSEVRYP